MGIFGGLASGGQRRHENTNTPRRVRGWSCTRTLVPFWQPSDGQHRSPAETPEAGSPAFPPDASYCAFTINFSLPQCKSLCHTLFNMLMAHLCIERVFCLSTAVRYISMALMRIHVNILLPQMWICLQTVCIHKHRIQHRYHKPSDQEIVSCIWQTIFHVLYIHSLSVPQFGIL